MWFDKYYAQRRKLILLTVLIALLSLFGLTRLKFAFNFEQFFPTGDPDLAFFQEFVEEFETDDNFLLVALERNEGVFDSAFLQMVDSLSKSFFDIPHVKEVQSLTLMQRPVISPAGLRFQPLVDINNQKRLDAQASKLLSDERLVHNLINEAGTSTVIAIKTEDGIQIEESRIIMDALYARMASLEKDSYYILGRAYFQTALSELQFKEILISTIISGVLISIIMVLIFRRWRSILIALSSIGLALLIFLGLLSVLGRQLSLMSALYPILMLIVGTSDVIHIMTKYMDELEKGSGKRIALETTIRQIGLATLLTSLTTAIGFATLLSSQILPIRDFGINAAMGVLVAFIVMISFTCPLMSLFSKEQITFVRKSRLSWNGFLSWCYTKSRNMPRTISIGFLTFIVLSLWGISKIHTNYELESNLPKGAKITEDFRFFENEFAGFRPLEIAIVIGEGRNLFDYEVVKAINKTEQYIRSHSEIQTSTSLATAVKSINEALQFYKDGTYSFPDSSRYASIKPFVSMIRQLPEMEMLISSDRGKTRISSRIRDVGAENIKALSQDIDNWIQEEIDSSVVRMKQTGTGLILDKNAEFVRQSLLYGLGFAILIVSILMGMLFKQIKYLLIAIIPNVVPLVFAAALLGFGGIPLEAGTSIVFAIIFGIAVDDTIHFMSKYKLAYNQYGDVEKALYITFTETGKAIIYTSIVLFFGFLVLLFSSNQPSVIIGLLISVTLISAVIADLFLLPLIIRKAEKLNN